MFNESDATFSEIVVDDAVCEVTHGTIENLLGSDRSEVRRNAWNSYIGFYNKFARTYTECLAGEIRARIAVVKTRGYSNALEAALDGVALPVSVFENTVATIRQSYPVWHRFWEMKRRALNVEYLTYSDVFAPLTKKEVPITYVDACETIINAMTPLGPEYVAPLADGVRTERWVDLPPRAGKRSNAYSGGVQGTKPFILINWSDNFRQFSILAHELGHSMHSYFTWKHQPWCNSSVDIFTGEVASIFNQAMVRSYLLKTQSDANFRLQILEEAFSNIYRYLFWMPVLSQFEREATVHAESGGALTAPWCSKLMTALLQEAYGPAFRITEEDVGMSWASYVHLYHNFYAFQYSTGIAAAYSLSAPIIEGDAEARDRYIRFLSAGRSDFSLRLLQQAGVDLTTPQPITDTFAILSGYIDEYERLLFEPSR